MNNDRRVKLTAAIESLRTIEKEIRTEEKAEGKAFNKMPVGLRGKKATKKNDHILFLLDDAQCCIGDAYRLLRKAAK